MKYSYDPGRGTGWLSKSVLRRLAIQAEVPAEPETAEPAPKRTRKPKDDDPGA